MKRTMASFRRKLNDWYKGRYHQHNSYRQVKRDYGDYLYFQDRGRFDVMFAIWNVNDTQQQFESKC